MGRTALAFGALSALLIAAAVPSVAGAEGEAPAVSARWHAAQTSLRHHTRRYAAPRTVVPRTMSHYPGPGPYPYGPGPYYRAAPFPFFPYFGYGWAW